jgi:hypothetical protein
MVGDYKIYLMRRKGHEISSYHSYAFFINKKDEIKNSYFLWRSDIVHE